MRFSLCSLAICLVLGGVLRAQTTWTGAASSDWGSAANWSAGIPTATTRTTIPAGTPNGPSTALTSAATCRDLTIQSGASLEVSAATTLSIHGALNSQESISGSGTLRFAGSGSVSAYSPASVPNVEIAASGSYGPGHNLEIRGDFRLVSGAWSEGWSVHVQGHSLFSGGTAALHRHETEGNVSFTGTSVTSGGGITCRGDWNSDASFQPSTGTTVLDGTGAQVFNGAASRFASLEIGAAAVVATAFPLNLVMSLTVDGALSSSANCQIGRDLIANGSFQTSGTLDVDRNCTVNASGALDLGSRDHSFGGSFRCSGALTASGWLRFDGSGSIASTPVLPRVRIAGTSNGPGSNLTIAGDFVLASGSWNEGWSVHVLGDSLFTGGTATLHRHETEGDVSFAGTSVTSSGGITCRGDWNSDSNFLPSSGTVVLDGSGAQVFNGAASRFAGIEVGAAAVVTTAFPLDLAGHLTVDGALGTTADVDVAMDLTVNGILQTTARLDVGRHCRVNASGALDLGSQGHDFGGSFACQGSLTGFGTLRFDGSGSIASTPSLPAIEIAGTSYSPGGNLTIAGNFTHAAGSWSEGWNVHVLGDSTFAGGTASLHLHETDGQVNFAGTSVTGRGGITCRGSWTSDAAFQPTSGTVTLDGTGAQSFDAGPSSLWSLQIGTGAVVQPSFALQLREDLTVDGTLTMGSNVTVARNISVGGNFQLTAILDIDGRCAVGASGALDLGAGTHTFSGSFACLGSLAASGLFVFDGSGTIGSSAILPDLQLQGGTYNASSPFAVGGDFAQDGGSWSDGGWAVHIQGDGDFRNGSSEFHSTAVDGDVTIQGGVTSTDGTIRCGGDFSADNGFAPIRGTVTFAGSGTQLMTSLGPNPELVLNRAVFASGVRRPSSDLLLHTKSIIIESGATFDLEGRKIQHEDGNLSVRGTLEVDAGAELELPDRCAVDVLAGGTLRVVGTYASPAVIGGYSTGSYTCRVAGRIEALNFVFEDMGPAGIEILSSAALGSYPRDFRSGTLARGSTTPGSVLLDLSRTAATELHRLTFQNNGTASHNIRSNTSAPIRLINWRGSFAGATFEDDPGGVIEWVVPQPTLLDSFRADGRRGGIQLSFRTRREVTDLAMFRIGRSTSPAGPFTEISASPIAPQGSPTAGASYAVFDLGVQFPDKVHYQLEEELIHGERLVLGVSFARPWPEQWNQAVWVGGVSYPDLAAGIAGAPRGGIVLVPGGTHPAFTLDRPLRIVPDGTGPVRIDTSAGPLVIRDLLVTDPDVGLYDLQIGSGVGSAGVEVINCDNVIVLDGIAVNAGSNADALRIDDSPHVAVQGCALAAGAAGLRARNSSVVYLSGGSLGLLRAETNSRITYCGVNPGSTSADPGSSLSALAGTMPAIEFPLLIASEKPVVFRVSGAPGALFSIYFTTAKTFADVSALLPIDMVMLIDFFQAFHAGLAVLPPGGVLDFPVVLPGDPMIWGNAVAIQAVVFDPASLQGRFTNARDLIIVP